MNKVTDLGNRTCVVYFMIVVAIFGAVSFITGKNLPDLLEREPESSASTIEVVNLPTNTMTANSSPTLLITPTMLPVSSLHKEITGIWDLSFAYKGYTSSNGIFTDRISTEKWKVNLLHVDHAISGELISVNSNYTDACLGANIEGVVENSNIKLFVYFNGTCCPGEIGIIEGVIQSDKLFIGKYQPGKIPSEGCILSTGEVTGVRQ